MAATPRARTRAADTRARRRTDGHQRRAGDDERGDRRPLPGAHDLLVVGAGCPRPDRDRPRRGRLPVHARRQADPRLQLAADVGQHRPRRPACRRRDHRAGDPAPVRPAGVRDRDPRPPGPEAGRDPARRHEQGVLHPGRRRGDRERDQARAPPHRPLQAARPVPQLPRRHVRRDDPHRRLPPLGERAGAGGRRALPRHAPLGREGAEAGRRGAATASRTSSGTRAPTRSRRCSSRRSWAPTGS